MCSSRRLYHWRSISIRPAFFVVLSSFQMDMVFDIATVCGVVAWIGHFRTKYHAFMPHVITVFIQMLSNESRFCRCRINCLGGTGQKLANDFPEGVLNPDVNVLILWHKTMYTVMLNPALIRSLSNRSAAPCRSDCDPAVLHVRSCSRFVIPWYLILVLILHTL